ncbi:hypothetical protein GCM10027190_32580 [Spirosoma areae]
MEEIWTNPNDIRGSGLMSNALCNDANTIYWSGYDTGKGVSCIWATSITTGAEVNFSAGRPYSSTYGRRYASVVDEATGDANAFILGIAASSKYIFVARLQNNSIHVLNKTTGALVRALKYSAPRSLYVDKNDKLWMVQNNKVTRHTINADGTLSGPNMTLSGLSEPLSVQVSPSNSTVLVGDGGTNHVYKGYSTLTGQLLWTVGKPGSYSTSPDVTYDKFLFRSAKEWRSGLRDNFDVAFGNILADGSMWLGDMGNQRLIHFGANRTTVVEEILNAGYHYQAAVNRSSPGRVFCNYLEFEVDYTKPLQAGNGSWKLKRNWSWKVNGTKDSQYQRTRNITTLSNGRTYNIIRYGSTYELIEYAPTGIRYTGVTFPANEEGFSLYADGSLWSTTSGEVGKVAQFKRRPVTVFDSNNNPIFGPAVVVEKTPAVTTTDPIGHATGGWNADQYTSNNVMVTFAPETGDVLGGYLRGMGYHLGGLKNGKWLWKTSKSTTKNYGGAFPADGAYDIGNSVEYAGNIVTTLERSIFWGYNGEFWKGIQTNKYNHFYDNGLYVGQFGVVGSDIRTEKSYPGYAGNSLVWGVTKVGNEYYVYHADEGQHGGIHRWKISNLNSIEEQIIPINLNNPSNVHGLTADYIEGSDLNNFNIKTTRVDSIVDFDWKAQIPPGTALSNPDNFSVRWKGYVQPSFSENYTFFLNTFDGVRLWLDGGLLIDNWNNNKNNTYSKAISLEAGKNYFIELEYTNKNRDSGISLSWSSTRQPKQKISAANLYPAIAPDRSAGADLMEGLRFNSTLENGMYGWNRDPVTEYRVSNSDYWKVATNVQTLNRANPDLHVELRPVANGLTATVTRDLGTPSNFTEWSVTGRLTWPKDDWDHETTTDKGYFEILDVDGKPIARMKRNYSPFPTVRLYGNDQVVAQAHRDTLNKLTTTLQPFSITVKSSGVTIQYGPYAPVTATLLDPTSKWEQPKTLRVLYSSQTNREHIMAMADMRFSFKTAIMPAAKPVLSEDDTRNTLDADHTLGTSAIIVSENGGAYKAYTGLIEVGNVDRPAGYWKFKAKGVPGRPESETVESPVFSVSDSGFSAQLFTHNPEGKEAKIVTFPNPVRADLQVQHPVIVKEGSLTIVSTDGKVVKSCTLKAGSTRTSLDVSSLTGGVYFIKYKAGARLLMSRFIKQ